MVGTAEVPDVKLLYGSQELPMLCLRHHISQAKLHNDNYYAIEAHELTQALSLCSAELVMFPLVTGHRHGQG